MKGILIINFPDSEESKIGIGMLAVEDGLPNAIFRFAKDHHHHSISLTISTWRIEPDIIAITGFMNDPRNHAKVNPKTRSTEFVKVEWQFRPE